VTSRSPKPAKKVRPEKLPPSTKRSLAQSLVHRGPVLVLGTVILAFSYNFFGFISKYSVNVLFYDQWDFLRLFFGGNASLGELFLMQHGPIREGVGILADKYLYALTDWNVRAEAFMIGGCLFVAMLLALLLKKRLFGRLSYSDVAIPIMFLSLAQWEGLTGTPNPAYSAFPLTMMILYCLALPQPNPILKYSLVLIVNFFLIYTGFGLFMGIVTIGVFALQCYWQLRRFTSIPAAFPFVGLLIAGASLGSFFLGYTFTTSVDCFDAPRPGPIAYLRFMGFMLANFLGLRGSWLAAGVGPLILLSVVVVLGAQMRSLIARDHSADISLTRGVLLSFGVLYMASTALGRICLGPEAAQSSRYTTLLIPLFLALYFFLLSMPSGRLKGIALGVFALVLIPNALSVPLDAIKFADGKRAWTACYLQTENIKNCDQITGFVIYPSPERTGLRQKLDYLKQHRLSFYADSPPR